MYLLTDEIEVLSSNDNKVILTNQRIHMEDKEWGHSYSITIFLENISSIEVKYNSLILALILAIIAGLYGLLSILSSQGPSYGPNFQALSIIISVLFFIIYFVSRTHVISISSNGGKPLNFKVNRMKGEAIDDFIYNVQDAKNQRIKFLNNKEI